MLTVLGNATGLVYSIGRTGYTLEVIGSQFEQISDNNPRNART